MESHGLYCWQKRWEVFGYRPAWQDRYVILAIGILGGRIKSLRLGWAIQRDPISKNTTKDTNNDNKKLPSEKKCG